MSAMGTDDNKLPRDEVYDTENRAPARSNMGPWRPVIWIVTALLLFSGAVWLASLLGYAFALFPGLPDFFSGWIWGVAGLIGICLMVVLLTVLRD